MRHFFRYAFLGLTAAASLAYAQSLDLRTGQWEFTMLMSGSVGDLAALPPEVRAQIESQFKQPQTYQTCLTEEDLRDMNLGEDEDESCNVTSRKVTGKTIDIARVCDDGERTETMHIEAPTNQSVTAKIAIVSERGLLNMTMNGKWLGATCEDDEDD